MKYYYYPNQWSKNQAINEDQEKIMWEDEYLFKEGIGPSDGVQDPKNRYLFVNALMNQMSLKSVPITFCSYIS